RPAGVDLSPGRLSPYPTFPHNAANDDDRAAIAVTQSVETAMSTAIPAPLKATVTAKVEALLTDALAPRHLVPRPPGYRWTYPVALYCRWWRSSCYLCATYRRPSPDGTVEDVEERFARLTYRGRHRFAL